MPKATKRQSSLKDKKKQLGMDPVKSQPKREIANALLLKRLADNEEQVRADAVASVRELVATKSSLDLFDLQKLWKGLWYTMWHSDTPAVQQALARDLADMFSEVHNNNYETFSNAFWSIALREWESLDKYRINKFYLLIRLILRNMLTRLQSNKWNESDLTLFKEQMISESVGPLSYANKRSPHSLRLHLIDIFADELENVFENTTQTPESVVIAAILSPITSQIEYSEFKHIKQRVKEDVLPDERLSNWGVVEAKKAEGKDNGASSEDSEWEGFE